MNFELLQSGISSYSSLLFALAATLMSFSALYVVILYGSYLLFRFLMQYFPHKLKFSGYNPVGVAFGGSGLDNELMFFCSLIFRS